MERKKFSWGNKRLKKFETNNKTIALNVLFSPKIREEMN